MHVMVKHSNQMVLGGSLKINGFSWSEKLSNTDHLNINKINESELVRTLHINSCGLMFKFGYFLTIYKKT